MAPPKAPPKKAAKKKNGYEMPKPLNSGDLLSDNQKNQWKIGRSIGIGGFGEIYSACKVGSSIKKIDDYPFVVKIEPKENGPLFVEMHFYSRNAKSDDIEKFKKEHKLKVLGMPEFIGSGTHEIQTVKHRFIVLPRFGQDIAKLFVEQKNQFPLHTVYRLGWQTLNVLEYIHSCGYVHGDIKGSNIMLGFGKGGNEQSYLLDFGLACRFNCKEFKPDPKKMHNGTIEYTPRDAHQGVPTMRGDIEILSFNLIEWAGAKLPWVVKNILAKPAEVQKAKEAFMIAPDSSLKACFGSIPVPTHIAQVFKYLGSMNHDTVPDYKKIRGIFEAGVKDLGHKNAGALEFTAASSTANKNRDSLPRGRPDFTQKSPVKKPAETSKAVPSKKATAAATKRQFQVEDDDDSQYDSPDEKKTPKKAAAKSKAKAPPTPSRRKVDRKRYIEESESEEEADVDVSPRKKSRAQVASPNCSTSKENDESPQRNASPPIKKAKGDRNRDESSNNDEDKKTITLKSKSGKSGKNKKTIHLNLNLDVSLGSDLVLVVNRKDKKPKNASEKSPKDEGVRAGVYKGKQAKTK